MRHRPKHARRAQQLASRYTRSLRPAVQHSHAHIETSHYAQHDITLRQAQRAQQLTLRSARSRRPASRRSTYSTACGLYLLNARLAACSLRRLAPMAPGR